VKRWEHVDLDASTGAVTATLAQIGGELVLPAPKTARSRRIVPLHPGIVAMLKRDKVTQNTERLRAGDQWQDSGRCSRPNSRRRSIPGTCCGSSSPPRSQPGLTGSACTLRHSAAVAWLEHGGHIKAVADLLGHSSISITGDTYGHTSDGAARSAVDQLGWQLGL
jgi:integrase